MDEISHKNGSLPRKRTRDATVMATQAESHCPKCVSSSKKARSARGISWREKLDDVRVISRAKYPTDFWSACTPWSIVKAQLTAACETQRQLLAVLMSPSTSYSKACMDLSCSRRHQQYLTAATSILTALGMDTHALNKSSVESETSVTARRIAVLQAVLESIDASPAPAGAADSLHEVDAESAQQDDAANHSNSLVGPVDTEDDGHDLSPVLFSANSAQQAKCRNECALNHVDSYVSFLDALDDEEDSMPNDGTKDKAVFGSLRECHTAPSACLNRRAGDVSTPSPPNASGDASPARSQQPDAKTRHGLTPHCRNKVPLTVFTSLSNSAQGVCASAEHQLSPRAVRVGDV